MAKTCEICSRVICELSKQKKYCSKQCRAVKKIITAKQWNLQNSVKHAAHQEKWRKNNRELDRIRSLESKKRATVKQKLKTRIATNLRSRIRKALQKEQKTGSAVRDLGCSIVDFKQHLESKFTEGMTWDNYGRNGWHIDHIKPLASFDLEDLEKFKKACHYSNLQPLWAKDNLKKSDKYE